MNDYELLFSILLHRRMCNRRYWLILRSIEISTRQLGHSSFSFLQEKPNLKLPLNLFRVTEVQLEILFLCSYFEKDQLLVK